MTSSPRVSLRDVARAVGVSHAAVSLALRGNSRISEARREQIAAVAKQMGYQPDPMLASLASYRRRSGAVPITSTVAWINHWEAPEKLKRFHDFESYWRGARDAGEELGYRLEEFVVGRDLSLPRLRQILLTRNISGVLIPPHPAGASFEKFDWAPFSIVRFGVSVRTPRSHIVTSDQLNCADMAFRRTFDRGYRRIGYVSSPRFDRQTGGAFRAGYLSAQDAFVAAPKRLAPLLLERKAVASDRAALRAWLKRMRPDAVITSEGELPDFLDKLGVRVPEDLGGVAISVVDGNFDSGVDQNSYEIGQVGMRTLASLIHLNERGIPEFCRRILVEGRWIDGTSLPGKRVPRNG